MAFFSLRMQMRDKSHLSYFDKQFWEENRLTKEANVCEHVSIKIYKINLASSKYSI